MYVKCGLLAFAAVILAALPASAVSRYDDSPCRAGRTGWTNDACAGREWGLARIGAPQAWRVTRGGDLGLPGPDALFGAGRINAGRAVAG